MVAAATATGVDAKFVEMRIGLLAPVNVLSHIHPLVSGPTISVSTGIVEYDVTADVGAVDYKVPKFPNLGASIKIESYSISDLDWICYILLRKTFIRSEVGHLSNVILSISVFLPSCVILSSSVILPSSVILSRSAILPSSLTLL